MTACIGTDPSGRPCRRERIPDGPDGTRHAHCRECEERVVREACGPVSWQDRAITGTLPTLVVGGVLADNRRDTQLGAGTRATPRAPRAGSQLAAASATTG